MTSEKHTTELDHDGGGSNIKTVAFAAAALGHPFSTEEPTTPGLEEKVVELNTVRDEDHAVTKAVIEVKPDPNKITEPPLPPHPAAATTDDENDYDEFYVDEQLLRTTESNRHIPYVDEQGYPLTRQRTASIGGHREYLVFANESSVVEKADRIVVTNWYGRLPEGEKRRPRRRGRTYLVACDFSAESLYAMEWVMGTMMRDQDEVHVVSVINREDNPEAGGMPLIKELKTASTAITEEAKRTLNQMLLFDIKLVTWVIAGRVKAVLSTLIRELPLTMVVSGSKGRGTVKGLLMGSISTYLVHNSTVPVSVIRPQKKKKKGRKKPAEAPSLSRSIKSGQLAIDEVSKKSR